MRIALSGMHNPLKYAGVVTSAPGPQWGLAFWTNDSAIFIQDHLLAMSADNETERAIHGPEPGGASGGGGGGRTDMPPSYPPANPPSYQQVNIMIAIIIVTQFTGNVICHFDVFWKVRL